MFYSNADRQKVNVKNYTRRVTSTYIPEIMLGGKGHGFILALIVLCHHGIAAHSHVTGVFSLAVLSSVVRNQLCGYFDSHFSPPPPPSPSWLKYPQVQPTP